MQVVDAFKSNKDAWDNTFDLPTVPIHNNPWLYLAYAVKVMRANGLSDTALELDIRAKVRARMKACLVRSGLYHKSPGGRGGLMSHDELLGLCYLDQDVAKTIYLYLIETDGVYANEPVPFDERANVFRIAWVSPVLRGLAGLRLSLITQAYLSVILLTDAVLYKSGDEGSRLRFWIAESALDRAPGSWLLGLAFLAWGALMKRKGMSPRAAFETYLKEIPEFRLYAPDSF